MARSHIELLQVQSVPWVPGLCEGRSDVHVRTLNHDSVTGAVSALVRYPAGWNRTEPEHLSVNEEIYVLEGSIEIDGLRYRADNYAYLPAGLVRRHATSDDGAIALTFYSGRVHVERGAKAACNRELWIGRIDPFVAIWEAGAQGIAVETELKAGARARLLRRDGASGAETFLLGFVPLWRDERIVATSSNHEIYLLSGDCVVNGRSLARSGAYCCRPAGTRFGPSGSLTPSVFLVRTEGGPYRLTEVSRASLDLAHLATPTLAW
jgi:hypothetical protein